MRTERETPETDAGFNGDLSVGLQPTVLTWDEARSFARHLERQLAELRELYALDVQFARAERDEAREEARQSARFKLLDRHGAALSQGAVNAMMCELDQAREMASTWHTRSEAHRQSAELINAENQALREALAIRIGQDRTYKHPQRCPACDYYCGHSGTCKHYATERKVMQ